MTALPYQLDRATKTITLPGVDPATFHLAAAIGMPAACLLLRGKGGKPPHVNVARRWANARRGWRVKVDDGLRVAEYRLRLLVVKVGGELLTLPTWVAAFERARARLGVRP